jgi:hypothetical protein
MTNEYFLGEFSSGILFTVKQRLKMSELIENNMINEYFSPEFSSAILMILK